MMRYIKKIWTFLSELSGVVATITLFGVLIEWSLPRIKEYYQSNIWLAYGLTALFLLTLVFLLYLLRDKFKLLRNDLRDLDLKEETERLSKEPANLDSISNHVPDSNFFKKVRSVLDDESKKWAEDGKLARFNFYLKYEENKFKLIIQAIYSSEWKNEELAIYYPGMDKDITDNRKYSRELIKPFYEIGYWREGVLKAYEKVSSNLPNVFELDLHSNQESTGEPLSLSIEYQSGIKHTSIDFSIQSGSLILERDGSKYRLVK